MSTILTSFTSGGTRFVAVRMMSGIAKRRRRGAIPGRSMRRPAAISTLQALSTASLKPSGSWGRFKVHAGEPGLHVSAGHQRAVVAEHNAAEHMQAGVGTHQRGPAVVFEGAADGGPRRGYRVAFGRDQVQVIAFAGADDGCLQRRPRAARRDPAADRRRRVEGRAVKDDAVLAGRQHGRVPLAQALVVEFEPVGAPGRIVGQASPFYQGPYGLASRRCCRSREPSGGRRSGRPRRR